VIDLTSESTLSLIQAARLLPPGRRGRPATLSCILRWVLKGAPGPNGERVKLEALRLGSRWVTSREALQRFAEALTPSLDAPTALAPRTPTARRRAAEQSGKRLDAALANI
jgi:hypothetical protein